MSSPVPTKVSQARRDAAKSLSVEERAAAVAMLPRSRRQLAARLSAQKTKLLAVYSLKALTPEQEAHKNRAVAKEAQKLAALVSEAAVQRMRRADLHPGAVPVPASHIDTLRAGIFVRLDEVKQKLAQLHGGMANGTSPQSFEACAAVRLAKEKGVLETRLNLLRKGLDYDHPRKMSPTHFDGPRVSLKLPPGSVAPSDVEVVLISNLLADRLPRGGKEDDATYQKRFRAMLARVLARLARISAVAGKSRGDAIQAAIEETVKQDSHVIATEIETGGVAIDPAADAMEPFVDALRADVAAAASKKVAGVPGSAPTKEQLVELFRCAKGEQDAASGAPLEESDLIAEDILRADEPVPFAIETYLTPRNLLLGGVAAAGVYLLSRRNK